MYRYSDIKKNTHKLTKCLVRVLKNQNKYHYLCDLNLNKHNNLEEYILEKIISITKKCWFGFEKYDGNLIKNKIITNELDLIKETLFSVVWDYYNLSQPIFNRKSFLFIIDKTEFLYYEIIKLYKPTSIFKIKLEIMWYKVREILWVTKYYPLLFFHGIFDKDWFLGNLCEKMIFKHQQKLRKIHGELDFD